MPPPAYHVHRVEDKAASACNVKLEASRNHQTPAVRLVQSTSANLTFLRPYAALRKPTIVVCSAAYSLLTVAVGSTYANDIRGEVDVRNNLVVSRVHRTPTAAVLLVAASLRDHILRAFEDEGAGAYGNLRGSRHTGS